MSDIAQAVSRVDLLEKNQERRLRIRYISDLPALCQKTDAELHDIWLRGKIQDISISGVRLLAKRPFMTDSLVVVEPYQTENIPPRVFEARVIYVNKHETGGWIMGCEFTQQLTNEELKTLLPSS
jgi:PilZ domain